MTDSEKIMLFEKYMRDKNLDDKDIQYNILVVKLLISEVLYIFNQNLENIDTYSFEEFTDMINLIDDHLGGRDGIYRILECMQMLTEFLKQNKLIKGGKIAYYKRMFIDTEHYLGKYDMMTGKKDDTKDFIKNIVSNKLSYSIIRLVEEINVYDFETLQRIDKILNDVPFSKKEYTEEVELLKYILIDLKLLEEKNGILETTKKGRAISRLQAEERYASLIYLILFNTNWINIINSFNRHVGYFEFKNILNIFTTIFSKKTKVELDMNSIKSLSQEETLIEISSDRFRIARAESIPFGSKIIDICFIGMGLLELDYGVNGSVTFKVSEFGRDIFKLIYSECAWYMKSKIESIGYLIKNKKYSKAEESILEFLSTYGGNTIIWDYLGQILLLKRNYKHAYIVLKHAYENSSKQGRAAKSSLYHLVLCCRKLKLFDDITNYEQKLQVMDQAK